MSFVLFAGLASTLIIEFLIRLSFFKEGLRQNTTAQIINVWIILFLPSPFYLLKIFNLDELEWFALSWLIWIVVVPIIGNIIKSKYTGRAWAEESLLWYFCIWIWLAVFISVGYYFWIR